MEDKIFTCPLAECGMKFNNEDHLTAHKSKHDLSLNLTPSSAFKVSLFDQTPTPTRFLKALESELFQELQSDNPFDATFRRANSLVATSGQIAISEPSLFSSLPDTEPLNTPSITLIRDGEVPQQCQEISVISLKKPAKRNEGCSQSLDETSQTLPFSPANQLSTEQETATLNGTNTDDGTTVEGLSIWPSTVQNGSSVSVANRLPDEVSSEQSIHGTVVQTPVITSVGSLSKASATCVPTAVVVTRQTTSDVPSLSSSVSQMSVVAEPTKSVETSQSLLQSVGVGPVVQLIIRLPDGQSMPVKIPMVTLAPSTATITSQPVKSIAGITPKSTSHSVAKMKLKEVLTLSKRSAQSNNTGSNNSSSRKLPSSHTVCISPPQNVLENSLSESPPSSPHSVHRVGSTGRRRREILEDPETKRKKSLERNRAAATRCRQKRKQWIQTLEKKADELAATNVHLQNEVSMLRNEVAQLKTMLLAHKDCPVTQQQKASGFHEVVKVIPSVTIPVSRLSVVDPNGISLSNGVELMDAETSSSQGSNASLHMNYVDTSATGSHPNILP